MAEQPDWAALLADRNVEGFVDGLLEVMSGWHQEAEIAQMAAPIDDQDITMDVDDVPQQVTTVTKQLKSVHLTNKNAPRDVASTVEELNKFAIIRARYHLRDTQEQFTGLHSLPGNLVVKIAEHLEDKPVSEETPLLYTFRFTALARLNTKIRYAYVDEVFSTQQFQIPIWPCVKIGGETGKELYWKKGVTNRLLMEGTEQEDETKPKPKKRWFHHLKFKIDPQGSNNEVEALESPVYASISFPSNAGQLIRPVVTMSVARAHPWRMFNQMKLFWRVAINSLWDRGKIRRGFDMRYISCMIDALYWFVDTLRHQYTPFERAVPPLASTIAAAQHFVGFVDADDEDLMEDVSESGDEDEKMSDEDHDGRERNNGDVYLEVLGNGWSPNELDRQVWKSLVYDLFREDKVTETDGDPWKYDFAPDWRPEGYISDDDSSDYAP